MRFHVATRARVSFNYTRIIPEIVPTGLALYIEFSFILINTDYTVRYESVVGNRANFEINTRDI